MLALNLLPIGQAAVIRDLELPESVEHHLMHMGFSPEARVLAVRRAPAGDPTVYAIDGMEIALRRETARGILVEPLASPAAAPLAQARPVPETDRMYAQPQSRPSYDYAADYDADYAADRAARASREAHGFSA